MDYTFTEKEVEMMYNWGYTSEIEHGFEAEEQKLYDKLERIFTPLQKKKVNLRRLWNFLKKYAIHIRECHILCEFLGAIV